MGGREPAVVKVFESKLLAAAKSNSVDDLSIPTCGLDRNANADAIFAAGNRLILVEFKSYNSSSNAEGEKTSACQLCTALAADEELRKVHDQCHFIAWGEKPKFGDLTAKVCIYRKRVCNRQVLPECAAISESKPSPDTSDVSNFITRFIDRKTGLECDPFIEYLRSLLNRSNGGKDDDEFRVALYGFSESRGVSGRTFNSYDDLSGWFNNPMPIMKLP